MWLNVLTRHITHAFLVSLYFNLNSSLANVAQYIYSHVPRPSRKMCSIKYAPVIIQMSFSKSPLRLQIIQQLKSKAFRLKTPRNWRKQEKRNTGSKALVLSASFSRMEFFACGATCTFDCELQLKLKDLLDQWMKKY